MTLKRLWYAIAHPRITKRAKRIDALGVLREGWTLFNSGQINQRGLARRMVYAHDRGIDTERYVAEHPLTFSKLSRMISA